MKKYLFGILMFMGALMMASCGDQLEAGIEQANKDCPEEMGNGMTMESIKLDGTYVLYTITVDESVMPMQALQAAQNDIKKIMVEELKNTDDQDLKDLFELLKDSDKGIAYYFTGKQSKKSCRINIMHDELFK